MLEEPECIEGSSKVSVINNDIRYLSKDDSKFLFIKGWLIPVRVTIEKADRPLFFPLYLALGFSLKAFLHSAFMWFPCQSPGTLFLGEENSPSFIPSGCSSEAPTVALDINATPVMEKGKLPPNTGCFETAAAGQSISGCPCDALAFRVYIFQILYCFSV